VKFSSPCLSSPLSNLSSLALSCVGGDIAPPLRYAVGSEQQLDVSILAAPHVTDALGAKVAEAEGKTVREILKSARRDDLIQDIDEAAQAKLWELYKASVVMCRRVIQISLFDCIKGLDERAVSKAVEGLGYKLDRLDRLTLGPLLDIEKALEQPLFDSYQRELAKRIKETGDGGAHKKIELEPDFVDTCIRESAVIAAMLVSRTRKPA